MASQEVSYSIFRRIPIGIGQPRGSATAGRATGEIRREEWETDEASEHSQHYREADGVLKVGREWGYTCPEVRISRLKIPDYVPLPKQGKIYQPAEARDIFSGLDRQTAFVLKLQSALLLRPCEVLGLSIHDFDFENKGVTVQRKAHRKELRWIKTKKPKRVPLAPATEKLVREWQEDGYIPNPNYSVGKMVCLWFKKRFVGDCERSKPRCSFNGEVFTVSDILEHLSQRGERGTFTRQVCCSAMGMLRV